MRTGHPRRERPTHDIGGHNDQIEALAVTDTSAILVGYSFAGGKEQGAAGKISLAEDPNPSPGGPPGGGGTTPPGPGPARRRSS